MQDGGCDFRDEEYVIFETVLGFTHACFTLCLLFLFWPDWPDCFQLYH